jgi:hypothetical protein
LHIVADARAIGFITELAVYRFSGILQRRWLPSLAQLSPEYNILRQKRSRRLHNAAGALLFAGSWGSMVNVTAGEASVDTNASRT